jgi:hypothetical protein
MLNYTYDGSGNLLKRNIAYSSEPYQFSTSALSYDIYLKNVADSVQNVYFPTWTEQNGQDDIKWYVGEKLANGLWKGTIILATHGWQKGTYITHFYGDGKSLGGISAQIKDTAKIYAPKDASLTNGFYEIYAEDVAKNVSEVRFPTWTENNGQDDLINPWITGEKVNDTTWKIRIPFNNHNFETGAYITHTYSFDKYGNMGLLAMTSTNVTGGVIGSKETDIAGVSYDVFIYGVDPQVQSVQFPTWTANNGQDDIEWIEGVRVGNGVWKGTVVFSKHNSEIGKYITHIYSNAKYLGAWEFDVTNSIRIEHPKVVKMNSSYYEITVEGLPSGVSDVRFPTWTSTNGKDDLEEPWIKGERLSSTKWRIRIPFYKHNNEVGTYNTHIYSYDAYGNNRIIGMLTIEVIK